MTPRAARAASAASTKSRLPDRTTSPGPFTAAIERSGPKSAASRAAVASEANTEAMAPPSGSAAMSRARSATRRKPSSSGNSPATQAAAYSPTLWPRR